MYATTNNNNMANNSSSSEDLANDSILVMKNFNLKKREQNQATRHRDSLRKLTISNGNVTHPQIAKTVELGIARRPSDNLLLKFNQVSANGAESDDTINHEENMNSINLSDLSPPNKQFVTKNQRPISDDSIGTKTSELFSSPSFELQSRDSSIENEEDGDNINHNENSIMDKSSIISEDDTTLIINQNKNNSNNSTHINNMSTVDSIPVLDSNELEKPLPPSPKKATYFFNNGVNGSGSSNNKSNHNSNSIQNQSSYIHSNKSLPLLKRTNTVVSSHNNNNNDYNNNVNGNPVRRQTYGNIGANVNNSELSMSYNHHSNSTPTILGNKLPLTASQKYRLRKEQNETSLRKSIKKKERFYEDQEQIMELQEGDIDDSLIWNIPMASLSTSSFLTASTTTNINHVHTSSSANGTPQGKVPNHMGTFLPPNTSFSQGLDFFEMPTSPIPGVSKVSDFQYFHDTTKNLSNVYIQSSERLSRSKLTERTNSAGFLPLDLKDASEKGMEDLLLVSENKLELMTNSRPSWLPPKDPEEKRAHEKQISKSISMASIDQLDRNKDREQRMIKDETNRQKFVLLLDRDVTRNSSINSLKKVIWETSFSNEVRYTMYDTLLQSEVKLITKHYIEPFTELLEIVNGMDFPKGKETELNQLIAKSITKKRNDDGMISDDLMLMLKIKSISSQGLIAGDELLFHHFLLDDSFKTLSEVWEMVNLLQMTCFNDITQEKYDFKILASRGVMAQYLLKTDDFKDEFNSTCLNFNTWWNILERIDHDLFMWIMDIIVVNNAQCFKNDPVKVEMFEGKDWEYYKCKKVVVNYKILLSFVLNVLLNYHFGFIDLKALADLDNERFCIPIPMDELIDSESVNGILVRKWMHYNKKF